MKIKLWAVLIVLLVFPSVTFAQEKASKEDDLEWKVTFSYSGSDYGQGECLESYYVTIPKTGAKFETISMGLTFIDAGTGKPRYISEIEEHFRSSGDKWLANASVTASELCFFKREVIVTKAKVKVDGKIVDIIEENKFIEGRSEWALPIPIKVKKTGE